MMPTMAMVCEFWDWRSSMFLANRWVEPGPEKAEVALVPLRLVQGRQWRMMREDRVMLKQWTVEVMFAGPE
jgi:hypothetical protein